MTFDSTKSSYLKYVHFDVKLNVKAGLKQLHTTMENISNVSRIIGIFIKEIGIVWYQIDNDSCIDNDTQSSLLPILSEEQ